MRDECRSNLRRLIATRAAIRFVELVVCVGLIVTVAVAALSALPVLARNAQSGLVRDAATETARNAIRAHPRGGRITRRRS